MTNFLLDVTSSAQTILELKKGEFMKKMTVILIVATLTASSAFAKYQPKLLAKNKALAHELTLEKYEEYVARTDQMKGADMSDLHKDALYEAKAALANEDHAISEFYLGGQLVYVVENEDEGNGCQTYFNEAGEYLNAYCGTESDSWSWSEK